MLMLITNCVCVLFLCFPFLVTAQQGHSALHLACQQGHNQSCRILLLNGCKPDIKNNVSLI